jgi:hypothetical protein
MSDIAEIVWFTGCIAIGMLNFLTFANLRK